MDRDVDRTPRPRPRRLQNLAWQCGEEDVRKDWILNGLGRPRRVVVSSVSSSRTASVHEEEDVARRDGRAGC